jgi:limonene 1,2-monooxygenase
MDPALRLGMFMAPFHYSPQHPSRALQRDLELVEFLDQIGYDEVWVGEHHSGGWETIGSNEMFLAAAAQRTHRIKLATGVVSLPYHHPFMVAERAVFLDYLSKGRAILGIGPGSLPLDAAMLGIQMSDTRSMTEEAWEVIHHLVTSREPITRKSSWFTVEDAQLQLVPYQSPSMPFAFTALASPFGPSMAGRYGGGLVSIGATQPVGFEALATHWGVVEEQAKKAGQVVSRSEWRVVAPVHVAETRAQARAEVLNGFGKFGVYTAEIGGRDFPFLAPGPDGKVPETLEEGLDLLVDEAQFASVGTPDDAVAFIQRLMDQTGGFGALLVMANDWAGPEATRRSLDLLLTEVAPHFQHMLPAIRSAEDRARQHRPEGMRAQNDAIAAARERYQSQNAGAQGRDGSHR